MLLDINLDTRAILKTPPIAGGFVMDVIGLEMALGARRKNDSLGSLASN